MNKEQNLVWIDLEMTGLDPARDVILEIATIITDSQLKIVAEGPSLVVHQPEDALSGMNKEVKEMHTKNGLIEKVRASKISAQEAEQQTLDFIKQYCKKNTSPLCGNSVWADKGFLKQYMPTINDYLHYRIIDVSTVKELVLRWYPEHPEYEKGETHRALDDIRESIEELKQYRSTFFR